MKKRVALALLSVLPSLAASEPPIISFSTYLGGSRFDSATSIAADPEGNVYVAGWTESADWAPALATRLAPSASGLDAFIAKFNGAGELVYCTILGGKGADRALAIAVDATGNAYVAGSTTSSDFPVVGGVSSRLGGRTDAFVSKIDRNGAVLLYSTYLGGSGTDVANSIAVSGDGVFVGGETDSADFPRVAAAQASRGGATDGFVTHLNAQGNAIVYSTFLGGYANDRVTAIAAGPDGSLYAAGSTASPNFPTLRALQSSLRGVQDAFVVKIRPTGALDYSTYLGGSGGTAPLLEGANGIAVDGAGNAYVAGITNSADFPVVGAYQGQLKGSADGFVSKISADGAALVFSTYIGGSGVDVARAVAVDTFGRAQLAGHTYSSNFPLVSPVQARTAGDWEAFLAVLNQTGNLLAESTYLGGQQSDNATALAVDFAGNTWLAGQTFSYDLPIIGAVQPINAGGASAFCSKLTMGGFNSVIAGSTTGAGGLTSMLPVTLTANQPVANVEFRISAAAGSSFAFTFAPGLGSAVRSFRTEGSELIVSISGLSPSRSGAVLLGYASIGLVEGLPSGSYPVTASCSTTAPCAGGQSLICVPAMPVLDDNEFFVRQQYLDIFNRAPTPAELSDGMYRLDKHLSTRAEIATELVLRPEFFDRARSVASVYRGALGREGEYNGWLHNLNAMRFGGLTFTELATYFLQCPEYLLKYGYPDNTGFMYLLYRNVLERDPDLTGLTDAVRILDSGAVTRTDMLLYFITSPEYTQRFHNPDFVRLVFFTQLRRYPDMAGWNTYLNLMQSGTPSVEIIDSILRSPDYEARFR